MSLIRIGVLSFAHYHSNFWCEAFRDDPRAVLAGIWDEDRERGAAAAASFQTTFEPSLAALLERVDAVAITSETARHRALIEAACVRRLPILCEKPLATSMADALAIEAAVAGAGSLFAQSFPKRHDPASLELKRLVETDALGKVWLVRVRHGHSHADDPSFRHGWWSDPALSGGGTLIDEGIHAADFLLWLFGRPNSVQATIAASEPDLAVEDAAAATFLWADGMIGEVATGWRFQAAADSIEIYGRRGTALLSGVDLASRRLSGAGPYLRVAKSGADRWTQTDLVPGFVTGGFHQRSATAFIDCLHGGTPPPIGLGNGMLALELILAAYRAARSGRRVMLQRHGLQRNATG
jgi:predicted dehydrogenase